MYSVPPLASSEAILLIYAPPPFVGTLLDLFFFHLACENLIDTDRDVEESRTISI